MSKNLIKIFLITILISILFIIYLSIFGIKTDKFNEFIKSQISEQDKRLSLDIDEVFIKLNIMERSFSINTQDLDIYILKEKQEISNVNVLIGISSILKKENKIKKIIINSKKNKIVELLKFIRTYKLNIPALYLENTLKKGNIIYDVILNYNDDETAEIEIQGKIINTELNFIKEKFNNISFDFIYKKKALNINNLKVRFKKINFTSENILVKIKDNEIHIKGNIKNTVNSELLSKVLNINLQNNLNEEMSLLSKSKFEILINKKFKIKNYKLESELVFDNLSINLQNISLKNYIEDFQNKIFFKSGTINLNTNKNNQTNIKINSKFTTNKENKPRDFFLNFEKKNSLEKFEFNLDLFENTIFIDEINFKKKNKENLNLNLKVTKRKNKYEIDSLKLHNNKNLFVLKKIRLEENFKITNFETIQGKYYNNNNFLNDLFIKKIKDDISVTAKSLDFSTYIEKSLKSINKKNFLDIFQNLNSAVKIDVEVAKLDDEFSLKNLSGRTIIKNNKAYKVSISGNFDKDNKFTYTKDQIDGKNVTTIFSDFAKPFVKKFKFVNGFENGKLDFTSIKINDDLSKSELRIYDFKLKDMPILTQLLSLASLQGIADLATGEGIRFNEFDMFFDNSEKLITINEIYALGPAISILMEGYVEKNKLVSLRGTLVPARTINKTIAKIPFIGDLLIGDKVGEGVFGVSFKIKGPPDDLDTRVNPIKTLTPRFITRTLEKIKKSK